MFPITNYLGKFQATLVIVQACCIFISTIEELSIFSLRVIEEIDLSHNNISGIIPKDFAIFPFLQKLNLYFNDFQGDLPVERVFSNANAVSLTGNDKLCEGIPELHSLPGAQAFCMLVKTLEGKKCP